jgi:hypothetical protein
MAAIRPVHDGESWPSGLEYGKATEPAYVVEGFFMPHIYDKMMQAGLHRGNFITWAKVCDKLFTHEYGFGHVEGKAWFADYQDALIFLLTWCWHHVHLNVSFEYGKREELKMKAYGVNRLVGDIKYRDMQDVHEMGTKGHKLDAKRKAATRRIWKKKERAQAREDLYYSM